MNTFQKPRNKEIRLLKTYTKQGASPLMRDRAHALVLLNKGYTQQQIKDILERNRSTIRKWITSWNKERMSSIFPRYAHNQNASKLTRIQKQEIQETLAVPPEQGGLSVDFFKLPTFKKYIETQFGVIYESDQSYYYLLKHSGYSWKLPSPFDRRRDDVYVKKRMKEISKEIKPYLKNNNWIVLTADETRLNHEEEVRRAWMKRGEKTVIKLERNKTGQSYFGALNQNTGKHHLIPLDWQNTDNMIMALERIQALYPNKHICLLWDNAGWHKSKGLREKLKTGESLEKFHLINFPPYAPDENPEEHVWKYGKEEIANKHVDTFDELKRHFEKIVTNRIFNYAVG